MRSGTTAAVVLLAGLLTACAQAPVKPAETHLQAGEPRPEGSIPPPVQLAPVLPPPKPSVRPETYSVGGGSTRSEEHTSELQSLTNLVCRLLLEKKKQSTPKQ